MLEVTDQGKAAMAAQVEKSRKAHADTRPPLSVEQQSEGAATAGMDAARDMREDRDGHSQPHDSGRDALKSSTPDAAGMMTPRHIDPGQFQRGPLRDGHAAYSRDYRPEQHHAPASPGVSGHDGPMASTVLEHGGRAMQRPAPRPGGDA